MIELAIFTVALVELMNGLWMIRRDRVSARRDIETLKRDRRYQEIREAEHAAWLRGCDKQWKLTLDGVKDLKLAIAQRADFELAAQVRDAAKKAESELNALLAVVRKVAETQE